MRAICAIVASLLLAGTVTADTINVPGDFETIYEAVSVAQPGDVILLSPGTYELNSSVGISKSLTIKGDGGSDKTFITSSLQNSWLFDFRFLTSNSSGECVVEGISFVSIPNSTWTIRFEGNNKWPLNGKVRDCHFLNSGGTSNWYGGGILFNGYGLGNIGEVSNCTFANNTVYNEFTSPVVSCISGIDVDNLSISNCLFDSNINFYGVKIRNKNATIDNCIFSNNVLETDWGAGINWGGDGTLTTTNCTFVNNNAPRGAAMKVDSDSWSTTNPCNIYIDNCQFKHNSADIGSAIYHYEYPNGIELLSISDSAFCGNTDPTIDGFWSDYGGNTFYESCDDADSDGIPDNKDNCYLYNPDQADCNSNDVGDTCDIADGFSDDININGTPDGCECLSDASGDNKVDIDDVLIVIALWGNTGGIGDVNYDGTVNIDDLLYVINSWGNCP
tara:strand:- start:41 stop:1378 length:1338 start_codon:yes stop_codon:yes gene_type:complete